MQTNKKFQEIQEFCSWLGYYNNYLSKKMYPGGTGYYSMQSDEEFGKIRKDIDRAKKEMNECYKIINDGVSIFLD